MAGRSAAEAPHPAIIDRLLAEAAALGEQARSAIVARQAAGVAERSGAASLPARRELSVVAACLGYSVAWLLERKARAAGGATSDAAASLAATIRRAPPDPAAVDADVLELGRRARDFGRRIERLARA